MRTFKLVYIFSIKDIGNHHGIMRNKRFGETFLETFFVNIGKFDNV